MTSTRSRDLHPSGGDSSSPVIPAPRADQAVASEFIDELLRRTDRLLDDSIEAVHRIRTHTEETDQQIEASRAFLADSYHTLEVLRRDLNKRR